MKTKILNILLSIVLSITIVGCVGYIIKSESGISNNTLDRVIVVYTADGKELVTYVGKIDLKCYPEGYVTFDCDGKRYSYYNCFVESIADIE